MISQFHSHNTPKEPWLLDYVDRFIEEAKSGERKFLYKTSRHRQWKAYHPRTIQRYKTGLRERIKDYEKERKIKLTFEDVDMEFYNDFVFYLEKRYRTNSIGNTIKLLKKIMAAAEKEKLHTNPIYRSDEFVKPEEEVENIYLNEQEIEKLYKLDLSERTYQEKIRDVFLVGCYTALRFGDYSRINQNHIGKTGRGVKVIKMETEKTGARVEIPVKHELEQILKKYNYNLPETSEPIVNREIKSLAREAGIKEKVRAVEMKKDKATGQVLKVNRFVSKCTRISTHTARRSGATNMYKAGIPSISIMKITGHRTEKNFLRYICIDIEENAEILSRNKYFSHKLKTII
jgi:integrase